MGVRFSPYPLKISDKSSHCLEARKDGRVVYCGRLETYWPKGTGVRIPLLPPGSMGRWCSLVNTSACHAEEQEFKSPTPRHCIKKERIFKQSMSLSNTLYSFPEGMKNY